MLIDRGHRRIAFIGDLVAGTTADRLAGLRDAVADAGRPFDRSMVIDLLTEADRLGDWSAPVEQATRQLMNRTDAPTAIFCNCDAVARLAYRSLGALNVRIPQQVSVVGFDDDPMAEWLSPTLSTVRQPFVAMGQAALELLARRIANPAAPVERRVLPVQMVHRESVAAPPAG
jgi:DNA-binding LacI/PurR family transcriptional regulator